MALKGLCVLEMAGLAPAPFCGLLLADLGARVIRVDRPKTATFYTDRFTRGKESIAIDLTREKGQDVFLQLCKKSDVLIDSYRPGVMEGLKVGPDVVQKTNPRLIYARMSGFGQTGPLSQRPGHDINFLAMSGALSMLGPKNSKPQPPLNLLGDFGGGGLLCAFGILAALIKRSVSGRGSVLDANLTDGTAYLSTWLWRARDLPVWGTGRGTSWFDGGLPWYDTYRCKDGEFVAVGCLEKEFFDNLLKGLDMSGKYDQSSDMDSVRADFENIFQTKTSYEWMLILNDLDACVTPVLSLDEAADHPHHKERQSFLHRKPDNEDEEVLTEPRPSPRALTDNTAESDSAQALPDLTHHSQHTHSVLKEIGFSIDDIENLTAEGILGPSS